MSDGSNILLLTFIHLTSTARLVVFGEGSQLQSSRKISTGLATLVITTGREPRRTRLHGTRFTDSFRSFGTEQSRMHTRNIAILLHPHAHGIAALATLRHYYYYNNSSCSIQKSGFDHTFAEFDPSVGQMTREKKTITVLTEMRIDCSAR